MSSPAAPQTAPEDLSRLSDAAVEKVAQWLKKTEAAGIKPHKSAKTLSAVLSHPTGLDFTVGFVDRVIRTEDTKAAAKALSEIGELAPDTLEALELAQIRTGSAVGRLAPGVVVPAARRRMRSMVGHMVVDARDKQFGKAVKEIKKQGNRLNINLLGEAVLGEQEADKHLADTYRLLRREDVDYVSIKVSSIASQISMWGFEDTVDYVVQRLIPLYQEAAKAPAGTKFINLDMEEYRDLRLTIAVFKRLLSLPETKNYEAGIVIQAYLPDALASVQELTEFANARVDAGGAGIKIRLVKGANLAMERVHADIHDWPVVTCASKQATDANYKLVLHWLLREQRMRGVRLGVAGQNLFDIAFAHLLGVSRGVTDRLEFEMLQGMAAEQQQTIREDVGQLLLYVPAVRPEEFDVAVSYLVRRLEENAAAENFMSGIFDLTPGSEVFTREEARFRASVAELEQLVEEYSSGTDNDDAAAAPAPSHSQDRLAGEAQEPGDYSAGIPEFRNEPDTNPALEANQRWTEQVIARATPEWLAEQALPEQLAAAEVDPLVESMRAAAAEWAGRPGAERAAILYRAADIMAARRGHLASVAAAEVGKAVAQSDPEISEAIDFLRYYAHSALALEDVEHAEFSPDRLVMITPPWNFPLAIPTGGTAAALAAGAAVIHKPSNPTPHCSMALLECLWDAGVPREVLHGIYPDERETGRRLISHPGVDRIILTGASETAAMFRSWKPELTINAETSGKDAMIITPAADRDLAVSDLVSSAFGHAGQKCSAASLGILVGSVYSSERFRRQLVDAASSLVVDWPQNLSATVGPLTEQPSEKLRRALTTLEPGEEWLLEPKQLDDTGRLWSPGIKTGVKPGSFFHLTEVFGPVLGLMQAKDLEAAIEYQNQTEFGLTGGIHSLEAEEVSQWLEQVQVGNAYVNRGITGAIVQRQPFGGWKASSVGLGSKAGGPNYVMLFGTWQDQPNPARAALPRTANEQVARLLEAVESKGLLGDEQLEWLQLAVADDAAWWDKEFGVAKDPTGLRSEANIFRYLPEQVLLRVSADARPEHVLRAGAAALAAGSPAALSAAPGLSRVTKKALGLLGDLLGKPVKEDDDAFASALAAGRHDAPAGGIRVRVIGSLTSQVWEATAPRPAVALLDDPVTASGRVELRYWVKEQSISMTLHRFGNPSPRFHELAAQLKA
ncbi:bifunctional proline dehydrogenase/L-glutamate gamma-semialdehyde dehydrogenase [Nesterenkonia alkaliphila]|uniref:L-glutamate gamma-semialdehyde dehydrogenase n=1 Tax=Nesterenkonia alkaliphila TaxID=1463631 RepID=A0A7K1UKF0_9MICC|nr:bifunctional proline dehydrogenase/L-glutamate gamma-semialdehyde dehydrogenase [Nesterenkonia alkaliphila]MVT26950.1 aldehyde dehydrogenase family protein [Nesterenkonia alkaliphila]GFZ90426.1 proline dehydrogenase [Nesterenkonia alkaliphila]